MKKEARNLFHKITQYRLKEYLNPTGDHEKVRIYESLRNKLMMVDEEAPNIEGPFQEIFVDLVNENKNEYILWLYEFGLEHEAIPGDWNKTIIGKCYLEKYLADKPLFNIKDIPRVIEKLKENTYKYLDDKSTIKRLEKYLEKNR